MELWMQITEILGGLGQFMFGLVAVGLSVVAFVKKRDDIFQSELAKKQFTEMGQIREKLSEIFFDVYYVHEFKSQLELGGLSIEEFRQQRPEQWQQYARYKENSLELFYKFMTPEYYLFPKWLMPSKVASFYEEMKKLAPFTIISTGSKSFEEIQSYQNEIIALVNYIDVELSKHA